jgi:predicted dehydrogenase
MELNERITAKIIGAGSIGNHLSHATRELGWKVFVTDSDSKALDRMRFEIYPKRYGTWDPEIKLLYPDSSTKISQQQIFDVILICTPPNTHLDIAISEVSINPPKILFIEKPLTNYSNFEKINILNNVSQKSNTRILVGYNHRLTPNTNYMINVIKNNNFGKINFIRSHFRENWTGIFNAHPWLDGPAASYLGSIHQGGGSLFEHSHGLDLLLYILSEISSTEPKIKTITFEREQALNLDYDKNVIIFLEYAEGKLAGLEQNVFTNPPIKNLEVEYEKAKVIWFTEQNTAGVRVVDTLGNDIDSFTYAKNRADDFRPEIQHIQDLINGVQVYSPICLSKIEKTQLLLNSAYQEFF